MSTERSLPSESAGFLLWRASLAWQRAITAALAPLGLTHVQFVLLATTWRLNVGGERPNQLALATHVGADVKMTSEVLRSLERKWLVRRDVDPSDTRARLVRTTPAGDKLAPRAIEAFEEVEGAFFADVDLEETVDLLGSLASPPPAG